MTLKIYFDFIEKSIADFIWTAAPIHMYTQRSIYYAWFYLSCEKEAIALQLLQTDVKVNLVEKDF